MKRTNNAETLKQAHQHFSRHEMESIAKHLVDNFTYTDRAQGITFNSRREFIDFLESWKKAFSDSRVTNPTYIDGGDTVTALFTARGTNDGEFGDFPATGKQMENPICEIIRFNDEGKMVSGEIYYDRMTLLEQLGHMKEAASQ